MSKLFLSSMQTGAKSAFLLLNISPEKHPAMAQNNRPIPEIRISCDSVMEFPDLVENARGVSRAQERELREGSRERDLRPPGSPLPSRCSSKLKMIIERQISLGQSAQEVSLRV